MGGGSSPITRFMNNAISPEMLRDAATATLSAFPGMTVSTHMGSRGKQVIVRCDVNRSQNVKAASELLAAFTTSMRRALPDGTINVVKRNGAATLRAGFTHMGRFCTEGLYRVFYVAGYEGQAADVDAVMLGGAKW